MSDESVGIDIECIKPIDMAIAERFFTSDETAYIMAGEQEQRFYEIWTKKESNIKWEGKGLHKPLTSFSVLDDQIHHYYQKVFDNNDAVGHVCSSKQIVLAVRIIDTALFLQSIKL